VIPDFRDWAPLVEYLWNADGDDRGHTAGKPAG
jgi:hypothetical protein